MQEIWDVYDKDRNKTGDIIYRNNYEPKGYHIVVNVWIRNSKGEWLISKRTANKHFPLLWECTGGSILSGEDSITGAIREAKEELGVTLDKSKGKLYKTIRRDNYLDFLDVWIFEHDCDISKIVLQEGETCDAMWADSNKIFSLIYENKFIPLDNLKYITEIISDNIKVTVDRPMGSRHPKYNDMIYPVNYGYANGIIAPDGEEQDVYILGIDKPIDNFEGKLVAIIKRKDDNEDKWVVVPNNIIFTKEEILEQVSFQEQYFDIQLDMI